MTQEPGRTALGALALLAGGPVIAILALLALLALSVAGYIVAGVWLGDQIVGGLRGQAEAGRPYLPAIVGLLALQATALLPVIGTLVWLLAQIGGVGAIGVMAWRAARGPGTAAEATAGAPAS